MPKLTVVPPPKIAPAVSKKALVRANAVQNFDDFVPLSWDETLERLTILLYGQYGAGKTTTAATASAFFPKTGLPKERYKGSKPKYVLEDMFWLSFDRGATHGFRERGIAVPEFSIPAFMGDKKLWSKAGLGSKPTIRQAVDFGLNLAVTAVSKGARWIVGDTITSFDASTEGYEREHMPTNASGDDDTRKMYGNIFASHKAFHEKLRALGCGLILCVHAKALDDVGKMSADEKRRLIALSAAGMPQFMPAITGKGNSVYKGDADLELVIIAKEVVNKGGLDRKAYTVLKEGWEAKSRFELSLDAVEEPDLGQMFRKIQG